MKLKEAYGHPSHNKLIRAYHNQRLQQHNLIVYLEKMIRGWMREMTPCVKCRNDWE